MTQRRVRNGTVHHQYDDSTIQMLNGVQNDFKSSRLSLSESTSDSYAEDSLARARSRDLENRRNTIARFIEQHSTDLHKHVAQLRKFACGPGGLIDDKFREVIWPVLAEHIPPAAPLTPVKEEESSSEHDSDFESAQSTLSTNEEDGEDPPEVIELPEPSLEDLRSHGEWNQVEMDVNRVLARFPPHITDDERHSLQTDLTPLIVRLLWENASFRYYQGFHDVCLTLMLALGREKAFDVAKSLAKSSAFRAYLTRSLEETALCELNYMYVLLYKCHPQLEERLRYAELGSMFALSWPLTWFSHALHEYSQIVVCFDLFLSCHWMMPIYVSAALVAHRARAVFQCEAEMPALHHLLNNIPADVNIGQVLLAAQRLNEEYPPGPVLQDVHRQYKRECEERPQVAIPPPETIPRHSSITPFLLVGGALVAGPQNVDAAFPHRPIAPSPSGMASTGNGSEDEVIRPPGAIKSRDGASTDGAPKDEATQEGSGGMKTQPPHSPTLSCEDSSQNISSKHARQKLAQFVATSSRHAVTGSEDADFNSNLSEAVRAIEAGVYPELISGGSSGSYFVYDVDKKFLAVFKPKDEEPFASLNPKWPKFFQRILCFCCFGRACLIPNHGYLSETGASLVDARLKLDIVPKTRIVKLSSPTFFYGRRCWRRQESKAKEGSYQVFVHGYKSSGEVFNEWNKVGWQNALTAEEVAKFTVMFQKMCVLDYLIRNTDRHMDNWLIRHKPGEELVLAAIDNGLAFPVKHPESASRFRKFPFAWATLHWAKKQWDPELREHLLKLLTPQFLHDLCKEIKILFSHDTAHNHLLVNSQLRVFRGQAWNLKQSLDANESPSDLVKRAPVVARRRYRRSPTSEDWSKCFTVKQADYSDPACC